VYYYSSTQFSSQSDPWWHLPSYDHHTQNKWWKNHTPLRDRPV